MNSIKATAKIAASFSVSSSMFSAIALEKAKVKNPLEQTEDSLNKAVESRKIKMISDDDYLTKYEDKNFRMNVYHLNDFGHQYIIYDKESDQYNFKYKIDVYSDGKIRITKRNPVTASELTTRTTGVLNFSDRLSDLWISEASASKPLSQYFP